MSQITVEFHRSRDPEAGASDVRDRVARARGLLPQETEEPIVAKVDADAQPILWLAFSSDKHTPLEITDYADRYVLDKLETMPGVANVMIGGERRYAMRLWLDADRLAALQVTPKDVEDALKEQNLEIPSGRIESAQREFSVLTISDLRTEEDFNNLVVKNVQGYPVRLHDIGYAKLGAEDDRNLVRVNGNPAVGLGVVKQATANTLDVAMAVKNELARIEATLPEGMKIRVAFDQSRFIDRSIKAVYTTMLEALALVVLVIFLFLRSFRATLIPFVTIPVSLVGAFIFLYAFGFSINVLTLLGLVLAIGLVVDDAIVMLENVHRHLEKGLTPFKAALAGSKEIAFAIVAMTLTLAAVFMPLAFMTGNTGRLFAEFAMTVAAAVLVSGFVALTLTPMMASKILRNHEHHGALYNFMERRFEGMNRLYRHLLDWSLKGRWLLVLVFFGVAYAAVLLFQKLPQELAPLEDRGMFIGMVVAPEGASLDYTDGYAKEIEGFYQGVPEIKNYFMVVAPGLQKPNPVNSALSFVSLQPWEERQRSQKEIIGSIMPRLLGLPGVMAFPISPPPLGQSFRDPPIQFVIQGSSYKELQELSDKFLAKVRDYPGLTNPDSDLKLNKPQLRIELNRDKIAAVDVKVEDIGRTLETLLGGRQVTRFKREGQQYDVILQVENRERATPADLHSIFVRNQQGEAIQLANLAQISENVAPKELNHFNRLRSVIITANLAPGYTLGQALEFMNKTAKETLDGRAQTDLAGQSREFSESSGALYLIFLLALVFIYLVLAAQFESFVSPLIIMLTVPLAMTGALLALNLTGGTLNVYSQIGLVMLVGLITKHGILIVEFANQLQERGMSLHAAVTEAATLRLRPILMTTGAMVLGALPLAMATGAGAESRMPIGWVIVGGLLLGTLFTLFIIPSAYTLLSRRRVVADAL